MTIGGQTGKALIDEVNATAVPYGHGAFWWLGQHGFIVKLGQTVLYIDAYLSPSEYRNIPTLLTPDQVTNATAIIGTHDHSDHIDRPIWPMMALSSPNALLVAPRRVRDSLVTDLSLSSERVIGIDDGVTVQVGEVTITGVPAAHELIDQDPATGYHAFLGVVVEGNGFCFYHAGDTTIYEGMQAKLRNWKFDLAFLPINGRDAKRLLANCIGNMTYQEAVDLAGAMQPGITIPTHFEMFNGNTEDPQLFMDYIAVKYPKLKTQIPVHGQLTMVKTESLN